MGITRVDIKVCSTDTPEICRTVRGAIVDTGATVSAIPAKIINELGIKLPFKTKLTLATGKSVVRPVGIAIIEYDGRKAFDEVIAIERGSPLLSVTALQRMGFEVEPKTRKLKKLEGALLL